MKYTIKEIKKELESYIHDKKYIEEKKKELEDMRAMALKITSTVSDMPKGSNPINDKIAEYIAKIDELQQESYMCLLELETKKKKIEDIINRLDQPFKNILYFRYIKGYTLTVVANQIGHDYKYCCVLHGRALEGYRLIKESAKEEK